MNRISFFLSSDDMNNVIQNQSQSYGPIIENSTSTKYRVTSKLSVENKTVYSVSEGEIIITNSDNPDLVNIFLKPQINYADAKLPGIPKVKYFVYRGIKKSSFFDENGNIKTTTENDILKSINNGNGSGELSPANRRENFKESFNTISNINTDICIDLLYVQEDYCQIYIDVCKTLGIASSEFGFEIMLEENNFNPTVTKHARLLDNIIDISSLSGVSAEIGKLEILNYIDPAAFFGSFFRKDNTITNPEPKKSIADGKDVYDKFINKFFTKNTVYVDIRNRYGLPPTVNRNGDSFSSLKISANGYAPSSVVDYATHGWPIHIINSSFVNSVTENKGYSFFKIRIVIPNKNEKELIHLITHHLGDSWTTKKKYNADCNYKKLEIQDTGWKKDVELRVFKFDATNPVASYIRAEIALYSDENKVKDQIVNYKLHQLLRENISNQLSPTLIDLGHTDNLTREKNTSGNKYKTYTSGLGYSLFSETKNIACELTQGKAIDSIGEVCFAYRTANNIQVSDIIVNKDWIADKGERANQIDKNFFKQSFAYNKIQNHFEKKLKIKTDKKNVDIFRQYDEYVEAHNFHKRNKSILSIHKIKFTDATDKKTIEIRTNDPILIRGLTGNSPAECFLSIAYTYSQRETIFDLINNNFVSNKFVSFVSDTSTEITNSGRKVFKQTFKLLGIVANGNLLELQEIPLSLTFYSIDGSNFVTSEYADSFKNEFGESNTQMDRIMTNDIIPQFEEGNPFLNSNFEVNTYTSITSLLNTISNNGSRDRILYNEIRDYLYDGDLDSLTFEIAFRLPFYIEDPKELPYTQVSINRANTDNNPFTMFFEQDNIEEWYTQANLLRAKQINPSLETLARSGLTTPTSNKKSYLKEFYDDANTKQEDYFKTVNLPVNAATTFNWENSISYFNQIGKKPHIPYYSGTLYTSNVYNLTHLKNAEVITDNQKTNLENVALSDFGYEEISDGEYNINGVLKTLNGKYVFKEANETDFQIYDFYWHQPANKPNNSSGITFGFGYDIGSRTDYDKLLNYLNLNSASVSEIEETVLNKGLQKKKINAMQEFFPFKNIVWDTISLDYNITIDKTKPILQDEYLNTIITKIISNRKFLKIYTNTESSFYKNDSLKILNIAELCVYSTFVWNRGVGRADLNSQKNDRVQHAKLLIHAFNTHDIRWLRYFTRKSGITHTERVIKFLVFDGIIKHYRK
jgi:hypothetical protein